MTQATLFDQLVTLHIPLLSYSPIASGAGTVMPRADETVKSEPHGYIPTMLRAWLETDAAIKHTSRAVSERLQNAWTIWVIERLRRV
ncbi:hypothetical protein [Brevundimonas sp. PAMC22021]|uniref:hypothetical protein n=1 Tax=Brevundimonas sp. PAMC22021 TaxID=2861285 RepID=UPI001C62FC88|nr:hypothetical protein [Brevundimonas sp. PAMC22021]QYF87275.1 hypothetical protein KY493_01810 [Brevundimonas sp. PAMC22021]